jgi:Icc-related predicted phosphoesterase
MATTLYYASDVHGSNRCFRKFLNAAKFYKAQVLIMGGDILGKAIVFLEKVRPGVYVTKERGQRLELTSEAELREFEKAAADKGLYPYRCREGERDALYASGQVEPLFERLMKARLEEWVALADERLAGTGVRCYMMGGNDDPPAVLEALEGGRIVCNPESAPVMLDDTSEMISLGWSNPTPWNTPRECSEDELAQRIDALMTPVKRPCAGHEPPRSPLWQRPGRCARAGLHLKGAEQPRPDALQAGRLYRRAGSHRALPAAAGPARPHP